MVRTRTRRRATAALLAAAIGGATLIGFAAPAGAASTLLNCGAADAATENLLGSFAPPGTPHPIILPIDANVDTTAPSAIDVGGNVPANFDVSVALPVDMVNGATAVFGSPLTVGVSNLSAQVVVTKVSGGSSSPFATISNTPYNDSIQFVTDTPATIAFHTFGQTLVANGAHQDVLEYRAGTINFTASISGLNLNFTCSAATADPFATTTILVPGPPNAGPATASVALGGTRTITLPVTSYPLVDSVVFSGAGLQGDGSYVGTLGTFTKPTLVGGQWKTTYTHTAADAGDDVVTYVAHNAFSGGSTAQNTVTVEVLGNECEVGSSGQCSLSQIVSLTVEGDPMYMSQEGGDVSLVDPVTEGPIVLNGEPQTAIGVLNNVTVVNPRGDGADWSLTGIVSDFKHADFAGTSCASNAPTDWDYQCIPGSNLAWAPSAVVAHLQVPGDVAAVTAGSPILVSDIMSSAASVVQTGLGTTQHSLCSSAATVSGGTFACGAGLSLVVPASASAGTYSATLTLTLA